MRRRLVVLASGLVLGVAGCSRNDPNPFLLQNVTSLPRPADTVIFTSNGYSAEGGLPREVFSAGAAGDPLRLTHCNNESRICDAVEAVPSRDGRRIVERRISEDTNRDGQISEADGASLVLIDLARGVEGPLVPASRSVSGIDWSPAEDLLVYTAASEQGVEDLFRIDPTGSNDASVIVTVGLRERRPRFDPTGSTVAFERIDSDAKGRIYVLNFPQPGQITSGGPGSEPLAGTPYVVGSDADPVYSPDGREIAFRRLVATGNGGFGIWHVLAVSVDGSGERVVTAGPAYRGAPDWGPRGIVFVEIDADAARSSLVAVQPDGSGRTSLVSGSALLSNPRWLR